MPATRTLTDINTSHITTDTYVPSMPSTDTKPIIHNAGAFFLQPRGISVITVQTPTELNTQHIYTPHASDDLP